MDTHASRWIGLVSVSDFHSDESTKSQWLLSEYSAAVWSGWRVQVADSVQIVAVSVLNESQPAAAQTAHRTHIAQYQKDTHRTVSKGTHIAQYQEDTHRTVSCNSGRPV